ncbi:hypothetical protein [Paenibacillus tengchongensis]|uniref:hypothetical protein n=1 Tax=Paenibacillus tengchongensis TaxID=2608684 RepID=UPI00124C82BD|nr:hypothetical protein [Paenibacillus tengchongensis]
MHMNKAIYILILMLAIPLAGCTRADQMKAQAHETEAAASVDQRYALPDMKLKLPPDLQLARETDHYYLIQNADGEVFGEILSDEYSETYDYSRVKPNHSSMTAEEQVKLPIGDCRLITLDADNGSAASGRTGTHDQYYAIVTVKDAKVYILNFTRHNKALETKQEFIKILESMEVEVS